MQAYKQYHLKYYAVALILCIHGKHGHYIEGKIDMEINKGDFILIFLKKKVNWDGDGSRCPCWYEFALGEEFLF